MQFTSFGYLIFLFAVAVCYLTVPKKMQNMVLLAASIVFYVLNCGFGKQAVWKSVLPLCVLAGSIMFTFTMAKAIAWRTGKAQKGLLALAVLVCVAVLCLFKYSGLVLPTLLALVNEGKPLGLPLGISFFTFASIAYLVDVARGDVAPEENFINYAVFICFFGTITSGPILRAGSILPQLREEHRFDYTRTADALRVMLIGYFRWLAVANVISLFTNVVFENVRSYSGGILTLSIVLYALQLYFEFAGYSEIALASGAVLGLNLPVNFNTPYFATNFSGFWNRWHISLSSWLNDFVFMPLVWSGWQTKLPGIGKKWQGAPVLTSLFCVFLISGFWHGNTLPFVVWGVLQAAYRIGEELLHRWRKPAKRPKPLVRFSKSAVVFVLWGAALVFFRMGLTENARVADGFYMLWAQFSGGAFAKDCLAVAAQGFYAKPIMIYAYFVYILLVLAIGFAMDYVQCFKLKGKHIATKLFCRKAPLRFVLYWCFVCIILAAFIMQSGGYGGGISLTYANF